LLLVPFLYKEVELLARVIGDWRLTPAVPAWESALFGGQPSQYLGEWLAFVPLSELLHFCYLAQVIVIPAVAAWWYVSGRRAAFGELLLTLSAVLLASYLFFILLPVDSPYYLSPRLGPPLSGHLFFDLVHQMSARGGARGGAFPSAHVSSAVVVSLVAWRHQRGLAYVLVPITVGVAIATVYGRFHYALDALAGAALAVAILAVVLTRRQRPEHRRDVEGVERIDLEVVQPGQAGRQQEFAGAEEDHDLAGLHGPMRLAGDRHAGGAVAGGGGNHGEHRVGRLDALSHFEHEQVRRQGVQRRFVDGEAQLHPGAPGGVRQLVVEAFQLGGLDLERVGPQHRARDIDGVHALVIDIMPPFARPA
jgi:membrane-associated phospholipid phosphatase